MHSKCHCYSGSLFFILSIITYRIHSVLRGRNHNIRSCPKDQGGRLIVAATRLFDTFSTGRWLALLIAKARLTGMGISLLLHGVLVSSHLLSSLDGYMNI